MSWRRYIATTAAIAALLGSAALGLREAERRLLPAAEMVAMGAKLDGEMIPAGQTATQAVNARVEQVLSRRVTVRHGSDVLLSATAAELGATLGGGAAIKALEKVGREPDWEARLDSALQARHGAVDVPLANTLTVDSARVGEQLQSYKDRIDRGPRGARRDLLTNEITPHEVGTYVDILATTTAIEDALRSGESEVDLALFEELPGATTTLAKQLDVEVVVGSFETRFSYGDSGRAKNVERATELVRGAILMPGQIMSFNQLVGARSTDNGFHPAAEIYRGEMREGIGGGTCQVASTLHAAAFFGGLEIVERRNHSRPSGYIRMGLDATVAYPVLDLKLRNPFDFPVLVHATIDELGLLRFEIRGARPGAKVELTTATIGIRKYTRKIRRAGWLEAGNFRLKQKGKPGVSIKRVRRLELPDGGERVEESVDVYPPTMEVYLVPVGENPDELLPPLPQDA